MKLKIYTLNLLFCKFIQKQYDIINKKQLKSLFVEKLEVIDYRTHNNYITIMESFYMIKCIGNKEYEINKNYLVYNNFYEE